MGLRLGLGLGAGGGRALLDSDALAYYSRAGVASGTVSIPQYDARNILSYSEQFDNAYWGKNQSSISANTTDTTDPLNGNTADKLTEDTTAASTHRLNANSGSGVPVSSGVAYTYSIYVKYASRQYFFLSGTNTGLGSVVFDLVNGTNTQAGTSTARSITSVGNGWYRISATGTSTSTTVFPTFNMSANSTGNNYTGDGTSAVYVWGAQIEAGSSVTTYVPTTAVAGLGIAGTITVNPRQQILDFVKGVKALGLWSNLACYPMRSFQNKGSGLVAYSLGGLGTYDGDIRNSLSWGQNGLVTQTVSSHVRTNIQSTLLATAGSAEYTMGAVLIQPTYSSTFPRVIAVDIGNGSSNFTAIGGWNGSSTGIYGANAPSSGLTFSSWTSTNRLLTNQHWAAVAKSVPSNTKWDGYLYTGSTKDTGTQSTAAPTAYSSGQVCVVGNNVGVSSVVVGSTHSFSFVFNVALTQTQHDAFYALYKSTIGTGLALP